MLTLIKAFLDKIDFLRIAETLRKRNNRRLAAGLHAVLIQSYEIIELYRILLQELRAALKSHQTKEKAHRFFLNPARIAHLLSRQSSNLEVMETITGDLLDELRVLDNSFAELYRSVFPGKFGILSEAQGLLNQARLSVSEGDSAAFPANSLGEYRTLWFTWDRPNEDDRRNITRFLYGDDGREKVVVEVNNHDGDAFFRELERYFRDDDPEGTLKAIEELTEGYRTVLLEHFSVDDLLGDIARVRRHYGCAEGDG
jgi:hypothetical protein